MVTLWANLVTLVGQHLVDEGMAKNDMLDLMKMLHDTNEATIRSPTVRTVAARRLMAAYTALDTE